MNGQSWYSLLWEQPFIDLWSISHTLIGVIFVYIARRLRINIWLAFSFSLAFAVSWEIMEAVTGISAAEFWTNHFSDVLVTQIGFAAGWLVFARLEDNRGIAVFRWVVGVFITALVVSLLAGKFLSAR